ncbi:tetratricopeptide repeat protein [Pseudomonadota bacterium]
MKQLTTTLAFITLAFSTSSFAISDAAKQLQRQWDIAKYQTTDKKREEAFEKLAKQAKEAEQKSPDNAEVLVWEAIILSTYAGEKGGFGALGLVKEAKSLLEKAEQIDANVLNGSAYTSLGTLYYQVPGWPVGFGSDKKAEKYLLKGLQIAPNDIDANYFYGDFLIEEGKYQKAITVLEKALAAPARPDRKVADQGREEEVKALLAKAKRKL